MTTEEALNFLRQHQPMPPTVELSDDLIKHFDDVLQHFTMHRDNRCVPLLLNSFGEGDAHGVYQLVEDVIVRFPNDTVIQALKNGLSSRHRSVRYWNAQIAANYPEPQLILPLLDLLRNGNLDERTAAITALERVPSQRVYNELNSMLNTNVESEVKELIQKILGARRSS